MRDWTNTEVSQKTLVVLAAPAGRLTSTLSSYSDTASVSASSNNGDSTQVESQEDLVGSKLPKVSRDSYLHFFEEQELLSILDSAIQTLQAPDQTHGDSLALARTELRPHLTMGQGDRGILGNPTLLTLQSGGLGMVSTNMQGSMNPRDTSL